MSSNQNVDLKNFLQNLKDLNEVAKQITDETAKKNQILRGGIADNEKYRKMIDKQRERLSK